MRQRRDGLHLNGVAVLERLVQNARGVNHLGAARRMRLGAVTETGRRLKPRYVDHQACKQSLTDLPAKVLVVGVTHKQALGGKRIGLDLHVRTRDLVDKGRLANVGKARYEECARVGVNGRQTRQMLSDL